jgi:hypothetical protein
MHPAGRRVVVAGHENTVAPRRRLDIDQSRAATVLK